MSLINTQAPQAKAKAVKNNDIIDYDIYDAIANNKYVLLFFYPKDFTFVCPTELIAFDDKLDEFHKRGVEVVACSTDQEFSHHAWNQMPRKEGGLGGVKYPILADTNKEISANYGVLSPEGVAYRGLFLIDQQGIIQHMLINNMPLGRNVEEALRIIDALQFHEQHGEVCPANWQPGKPTMTPNPNDSKKYFQQQD